MKARQLLLNLPHCEGTSEDVKSFVLQKCATYAEAADFFMVDQTTVERWMSDRSKPHPSCIRLVYVWQQLQEVKST